MKRTMGFGVVWAILLLSTCGASAQEIRGFSRFSIRTGGLGSRGDSTSEIKSMQLLNRPDRIGHVYGNTVRRRHTMGRHTWLFDPSTQAFAINPAIRTNRFEVRVKEIIFPTATLGDRSLR